MKALLDFVKQHTTHMAYHTADRWQQSHIGAQEEPIDVFFFKVLVKGQPDVLLFKQLIDVNKEKGQFCNVDLLDGRPHSYIEIGGWVGDQTTALHLMGLGAAMHLWTISSEKNGVEIRHDKETPLEQPHEENRNPVPLVGMVLPGNRPVLFFQEKMYDNQGLVLDSVAREIWDRKNEAYLERNRLVSLLARLYPSGLRRTDIEGWDSEWHGCVMIDSPVGQLSWHYHDSQAHLFEGLPQYEGDWDGHTTAEKYARIEDWVQRLDQESNRGKDDERQERRAGEDRQEAQHQAAA